MGPKIVQGHSLAYKFTYTWLLHPHHTNAWCLDTFLYQSQANVFSPKANLLQKNHSRPILTQPWFRISLNTFESAPHHEKHLFSALNIHSQICGTHLLTSFKFTPSKAIHGLLPFQMQRFRQWSASLLPKASSHNLSRNLKPIPIYTYEIHDSINTLTENIVIPSLFVISSRLT